MTIPEEGEISMQFVKTADLKPGMRLAKPIYNRMGVLLYERDTRLTIQGINSIENFGLIGIFILEPAEPLPPLSREDLEFEQFQTIYMFKLKDNMDKLVDNLVPSTLLSLVDDITASLLYDFGYLYVPQAILDKGDDLSDSDRNFIQMNLERGYESIRPRYEECNLPKISLEIIQQFIFQKSQTLKIKDPSPETRLLCDILKVADQFDRLTAMNINNPPVSEVAAMSFLRRHSRTYNPRVVAALAECIHILPTGACVDLSDGEKALVLVENAADFTRPMILKFSNNMIYDLSDPVIGDSLRVTDIMKTMDNRIAIDEEALEHFVADQYIRETADRFRQKKLAIAQRKQKAAQKKSMDDLLDNARVLTPPPIAPVPEEDASPIRKAPRKRMKLV